MTREEYYAKVQSMPQELQNQFRQSLEMSLSKKIVNRFMNVVMQAYAWGQRSAQTGGSGENADYMRGAKEMKAAMEKVSDMEPSDIYKYFGLNYAHYLEGLYNVLRLNVHDILEGVTQYTQDQAREKGEREQAAVKAMAEVIGIDRLLEIAGEIKRETVCDLPF